MLREVDPDRLFNDAALKAVGLDREVVAAGISAVHRVLDGLDATLIGNDEARMAGLIELANLSAVIGNLLRGGIAKASGGRFVANGPHKYPDLLSTIHGIDHLEIKVALETNKPKGHLAKPGPHLTCRYVLADEQGRHTIGKQNRGDVAWIWEVRTGVLGEEHFNISNTPGDSGKTAVINKAGFGELHVVYVNPELCPYGANTPTRREYVRLMQRGRGPLL